MAEREFDIIVYGATGYTGRLVAEHFVREYHGKAGAPKWAMAGRSLTKLQEVRDEIGAPSGTPLVVADADDPASLEAMCERTRVVLTTVGPYQLYGDALVAATLERARAYADAGAGSLFVPFLLDPECIGAICDASPLSVVVSSVSAIAALPMRPAALMRGPSR